MPAPDPTADQVPDTPTTADPVPAPAAARAAPESAALVSAPAAQAAPGSDALASAPAAQAAPGSAAPADALVPAPVPVAADALAAIAARFGVRAAAVRPIVGGVANHSYLLGEDLLLRIPRGPSFERDLRKESAVIPVARTAGVRTPAVVELDDSGAVLDSPFLVMERVHGVDLAASGVPETAEVWGELGRELAKLHQVPHRPLAGVEADDGGDPRAGVERLADQGYIDPGTARWLLGWFDRLAARIPPNQPAVLLHGDVALQNLLADEASGEFRALIDWGDAAWGPPGMEFAKLSLFKVAAMLPSYRHESAERTGLAPGELEASVLWFHLGWGLAGLARGPDSGERHWTAPPASRLLGVLRFFASSPPEPWSGLT